MHIVFCDMYRFVFTFDVKNPLMSAWQPSVDGGKHAFLEQVRFPRPTPRRLLKSGREPFYSRAGIIFCILHFFRLEARKFWLQSWKGEPFWIHDDCFDVWRFDEVGKMTKATWCWSLENWHSCLLVASVALEEVRGAVDWRTKSSFGGKWWQAGWV